MRRHTHVRQSKRFTAERTRTGIACGATLLLGVAIAWAQTPTYPIWNAKPESSSADSLKGQSSKQDLRLREGTDVQGRLGYFRKTGDRLTFLASDGVGRFVGLENLALQRIAKAIEESPSPAEWSVTGRVTEYQGANFLFVERAILASEVRPSAAKVLSE